MVEDIRQSFGGPLAVKLSYVCAAHNTDANTGLCVAGSATSLASHAAGLAIDIQPRSITLESARRLWTEANAAACRFQASLRRLQRRAFSRGIEGQCPEYSGDD